MGAIGVDLGGTWIRAARVDSEGTAGEVIRGETRAHRDADCILTDLVDIVEKARAAGPDPVRAIGIALPTTLDIQGRMDPCPNLPTMSSFPIEKELSRRFKEQVWIENDARCFVMGEWRFGKGRGCDNVVGITLGTSVGLGIITGGSVLKGAYHQAGEIWRSPASIGGKDRNEYGFTVHDLLKGSAIEEIYSDNCGVNKSASEIASDARAGNATALESFHSYGLILGNLLSWVCNILDPEVVVIGGSGGKDFQLYSREARKVLGRRDIRLEKTDLEEKAAILGAAYGASKAEG